MEKSNERQHSSNKFENRVKSRSRSRPHINTFGMGKSVSFKIEDETPLVIPDYR